MNDFEKAAFIGAVIRGGLSLAKGLGKRVIKHPGKSLGAAATTAYVASDVAGAASTAAGRAGQTFNVAPPVPSGV